MLSDEEIHGIFYPMGGASDDQLQIALGCARAIESAATAPLLARIAELDRSLDVIAQNTEAQAHASLQREIELTEKVEKLTLELEEARKDAERYRWLRDRNSHHQFRSAWISSVTAVKDGPCDIFSADEVPALLDSEIDRRMAAISAAIKEQT